MYLNPVPVKLLTHKKVFLYQRSSTIQAKQGMKMEIRVLEKCMIAFYVTLQTNQASHPLDKKAVVTFVIFYPSSERKVVSLLRYL